MIVVKAKEVVEAGSATKAQEENKARHVIKAKQEEKQMSRCERDLCVHPPWRL